MSLNKNKNNDTSRSILSRFHTGLLSSVSVCCLFATGALAGPSGGNVAAGAATISGQGSTHVVVNQSSQRVVIDWADFDVGVNERIDFVQPNRQAIALNRVTSNTPTKILGNLRADGRVVVINRNGVVLGNKAKVDVAGLVLSTADVSNNAFMNNDAIAFDIAGNPDAKIINQGQITVRDAGLAGFVAAGVENQGTITAQLGKVQLHSGSTFTLDLAGDELVQIAIADDVAKQLVKNSGSISGNQIQLTAAQARNAVDNLVVNTGTLEASSVSTRGGKIILGGNGASVIAEGKIRANGTKGGDVKITGRSISTNGTIEAKGKSDSGGNVVLTADTALESGSGTIIDVSGTSGGSIIQNAAGSISSGKYLARGTTGQGGSIDWGGNISLMSATLDVSGINGGQIHLGGLWQNPTSSGWDKNGIHLDAGQNIVASKGTKILAYSTAKNGTGGEIVIRAQDKAYFGGAINTRGGSKTGIGGRAEVSGNTINLIDGYDIKTGHVGRAGTLLLDPQNITIGSSNNIDAIQMLKLAHQYALVNSDYFGVSSSLNNAGTIMAVGAYGDDTGGSARGAVYLFSLDPAHSNYGPVFRYKIAHGTAGGLTITNTSQFGMSLDLNGAGNILAVGSNLDDTGGTDRGAVYLFNLNTNNLSTAPTLAKKLAHGVDGISLVNSDIFGYSVALNDVGNILAVGAASDDTGGLNRGAVYLIGLDPNNLSGAATLGAKITSLSPGLTVADSDNFGYAVAFNGAGNILGVGSQRDDTGGIDRGAVYLFSVDTNNLATTPTLQKKITHGTSGIIQTDTGLFGSSIDFNTSGSIMAVGAMGDDSIGIDQGSVYLFNLDLSDLTADPIVRQKIETGTNGLVIPNVDYFGRSLSLNGDGSMLVIGSYTNDTGGTDRGAVSLFELDETDLTVAAVQRNRIHNNYPQMNLVNSDRFGASVALNNLGTIMAVGASGDDTGGTDRGAVYLFNVDPDDVGDNPIFRYKIAHGNSGLTLVNSDLFGASVALNGSGSILAVGAHGDDTGGSARGAAYVFSLNTANLSTGATLRQKIAHGTSGLSLVNSDNFGISLSLNDAGNILAIGATGDDTGGTDRGAAYLWTINPASPATTAILRKKIVNGVGGVTLANSDNFGRSVSLNGSGSILVVGASGDDTGGADRGAVHILGLDTSDLSGNPTYGIKLANGVGGLSLANTDFFGMSADINYDGTLLAVGATGDDTGGTDRGSVYLFELDSDDITTAPTMVKKIAHGTNGVTLANSDGFGNAVALNGAGNVMAVGASADDTGGTDRGSVRLFDISGVLTEDNQTYGNNPADSVSFTAEQLARLLNTGNNVTLQASNDITIASDLFLNNPTGNGGNLTLQAGRSVLINANITTDNGNLVFIANDTLASGVIDIYRLAGAGGITMASGTGINAGTGYVRLITRNGAGKTFTESGDTTLENITASRLTVETLQDVVLNGQITASGSGNAIVLGATGNFINNFGATALNLSGGGRYLIYSAGPDNNVLGGIGGFQTRYSMTYAGNPPAGISGTNNMMLYSMAAPYVAPVTETPIVNERQMWRINVPVRLQSMALNLETDYVIKMGGINLEIPTGFLSLNANTPHIQHETILDLSKNQKNPDVNNHNG